MENYAYAIDFGTSNSLIAVVNSKSMEILPISPLAADPTILKSILYTDETDSWHFGSEAITEYSSGFSDGRLLRSIKKYLPDPSFLRTHIHGKNYTLVDLITIFLREMRNRSNKLVGKDLTKVVMGRPAAFSLDPNLDQLAEGRLLAAAKAAGFEEVVFLPEPIAAAYEFQEQIHAPKIVLVADFGGGTSDFTVLKMSKENFKPEDILSINGISIAGDRFDGSIMKHSIAPYFGSNISYKLPLSTNTLSLPQNVLNKMCSAPDISFFAHGDLRLLLEHAKRWSLSAEERVKVDRLFILAEEHLGYKLFEAIEKAKIALSTKSSATFRFDYPTLEVEAEITYDSFAKGSEGICSQIMQTLDTCVADAGIKHTEIDLVCLTGGTAKVPAIKNALIERFGEDAIRSQSQFHSVINGLALKAKQTFCVG